LERRILRYTGAIHLHFNLVSRNLGRAAPADRGLCNKAGTKTIGDWEWESSEGLEYRGLPSACGANDYNLEFVSVKGKSFICATNTWGI
jgi:hypothetical protein